VDTGHASPARTKFEAVFEAHHRRVLAYALRRSDRTADAEDAVSETFAIAWRRVDKLPEVEAALPWLLAITRRVLANQYRGRRRWNSLLVRLRPVLEGRPPRLAESPAGMALAQLAPADRELLRLLAWEGLSHAEAGVVLGISANAVAIRLHRARRRFADALASAERRSVKGIGPTRTPDVAEDSDPRSAVRRIG
jgi:RNA polymerase sigma-70 factor (ECF subfamily)